jgi:hypothetical protein
MLLGEIDFLTIVRSGEEITRCRSRMPPFSNVPDRVEVAQRFAHLCPINEEVLTVEPGLYKTVSGAADTLGDLIFMMGKQEVYAAAVNIEFLSEIFHRHGGTFDVPSRTAAPPR